MTKYLAPQTAPDAPLQPPADPPPVETPDTLPEARSIALRPQIFVFGSNTHGIHGKGAAKHAVAHHRARYGQPAGLQGTSYAIPTIEATGGRFIPLPLGSIKHHVDIFLAFAQHSPELDFQVTNIGCGLAGHKPYDIAPMFEGAPANCFFSLEFDYYLTQTQLEHPS